MLVMMVELQLVQLKTLEPRIMLPVEILLYLIMKKEIQRVCTMIRILLLVMIWIKSWKITVMMIQFQCATKR